MLSACFPALCDGSPCWHSAVEHRSDDDFVLFNTLKHMHMQQLHAFSDLQALQPLPPEVLGHPEGFTTDLPPDAAASGPGGA